MSFFEYMSSLFRDVIIGDPIIYGVLLVLLIAIVLFIARTPLDQILTFLILPVYGIKEAGYLAGPIAMSIWPLIAIMAGFAFFKNIKEIMGG